MGLTPDQELSRLGIHRVKDIEAGDIPLEKIQDIIDVVNGLVSLAEETNPYK